MQGEDAFVAVHQEVLRVVESVLVLCAGSRSHNPLESLLRNESIAPLTQGGRAAKAKQAQGCAREQQPASGIRYHALNQAKPNSFMRTNSNFAPKLGLVVLALTLLCLFLGKRIFGSTGIVFFDALLFMLMCLTVMTVLIAGKRAQTRRSWIWMLLVVFVWPFAYLYALAINRGSPPES